MYTIDFASSVSHQVRQCVGFYRALHAGQQDIWSRLPHYPLTSALNELWNQSVCIQNQQPPARLVDSEQATLSDIRFIARALELFIHVNDGRFCMALDMFTDVLNRHSNPFLLRQAFADAQAAIESQGAVKAPLTELRALAVQMKADFEVNALTRPDFSVWVHGESEITRAMPHRAVALSC